MFLAGGAMVTGDVRSRAHRRKSGREGRKSLQSPHSAMTWSPGHARPPGSSSGETTSFCGLGLAGCQSFNKSLVMCTFEMCWWRGMACLTRV